MYKTGWKEHKFCRQKTQKSDFYKNKKVTKIDDIDVNKILVSKEEPYGIKLSQMTGYVRTFEGNTTMSFKIRDTLS